jgi:hypothetical protein
MSVDILITFGLLGKSLYQRFDKQKNISTFAPLNPLHIQVIGSLPVSLRGLAREK